MTKQQKLTRFNKEPIELQETCEVTHGVVCDVYAFENDDTKDLGIVTMQAGAKTPLQKVRGGDKTIEGYISGEGVLTVDDKVYVFPGSEQTEIEVQIGETMQWEAKTELVFSEVCFPPYQDGRYENLTE